MQFNARRRDAMHINGSSRMAWVELMISDDAAAWSSTAGCAAGAMATDIPEACTTPHNGDDAIAGTACRTRTRWRAASRRTGACTWRSMT
jgi:hypothetical protein